MKVEAFKKQYKTCTVKVDQVRSKAKVTVFTGENGIGKTTLLKAMAKLIAYDGVVSCHGKTMYAEEIFRYPEAMKVLDYLTLLQSLGEKDNTRLEKLLDVFDLRDKLNKPLGALSKGFKQKVNLVQALMETVDTYILDEPLSGLDVASQQNLYDYIANDDRKYIIATHRWTNAMKVRGKAVAL